VIVYTVISVYTEITDMTSLSAGQKKFILHWGELGTRWGLNRSVAQIHALLYLAPTPLTAEQVTALLSIARSNVSTSLRELQGWGLVRVVHLMGDRRDHFATVHDVWEMFTIIVEERKRREIDPTIAVLRECSMEIDRNTPEDKEARKRIRELLAFFEQATTVYEEFRGLPGGVLRQIWKLKGNLKRLFSAAS
jgi:DNA-binding transcriptional regulator GbsR (MarR family)